MSYSVEYRKIPSGDKIHSLNVKVYIPDGEKKGILQISHGMTEHIERYDDFMGFMAENGFVCVAHDHLGHGKTVRGDDELGFIDSKDGWRIMVEDVFTVGSAIKAEYPALRMVLLGHSMGSFIARLTAFYHPYSYNALIIMGTGAKNPAAEAGIALTAALTRRRKAAPTRSARGRRRCASPRRRAMWSWRRWPDGIRIFENSKNIKTERTGRLPRGVRPVRLFLCDRRHAFGAFCLPVTDSISMHQTAV